MIEHGTTAVEEQPLSQKKKKAVIEYLGVMFAVAFLLVALSLLVKVRTMQSDLDAAANGARENIAAIENQNESLRDELGEAEQNAKAAELLARAQYAIATDDYDGFQNHMDELAGCAGALSPEAAAIYSQLLTLLPEA